MCVGLLTSMLNNMTGLDVGIVAMVFGAGVVVVADVVASVDVTKFKNENGALVVVDVETLIFGIGVGLEVLIVTENGLIYFITLLLVLLADNVDMVVIFVVVNGERSLPFSKNELIGFSNFATFSDCAVPESAIELNIWFCC